MQEEARKRVHAVQIVFVSGMRWLPGGVNWGQGTTLPSLVLLGNCELLWTMHNSSSIVLAWQHSTGRQFHIGAKSPTGLSAIIQLNVL